jgi:hypothetical protein
MSLFHNGSPLRQMDKKELDMVARRLDFNDI